MSAEQKERKSGACRNHSCWIDHSCTCCFVFSERNRKTLEIANMYAHVQGVHRVTASPFTMIKLTISDNFETKVISRIRVLFHFCTFHLWKENKALRHISFEMFFGSSQIKSFDCCEVCRFRKKRVYTYINDDDPSHRKSRASNQETFRSIEEVHVVQNNSEKLHPKRMSYRKSWNVHGVLVLHLVKSQHIAYLSCSPVVPMRAFFLCTPMSDRFATEKQL